MSNEIIVTMISINSISYYEDNINHLTANKMAELRESIKNDGIKEPLIVTKHNDGYVVLDGNHRLRIANDIGLKTVPCIVKHLKKDEWFHEHIILNYFRGEVVVNRLISFITKELDAETPIEKLTKMTGMSKHWVMAHYEMGKVKFDQEVFEKMYAENESIKVPIIVKPKLIDMIFSKVLIRDKDFMMRYMQGRIGDIKKKLQKISDKIVNTGRELDQIGSIYDPGFSLLPADRQSYIKEQNTKLTTELHDMAKKQKDIESTLKIYVTMYSDVENGEVTPEIACFLIDKINMAEFASLLGDLVERVTEGMVDGLIGLEAKKSDRYKTKDGAYEWRCPDCKYTINCKKYNSFFISIYNHMKYYHNKPEYRLT